MTDVRAHRVLASISRVAVLQTLRDAVGPLAVQDLAQRMGLHHNTVRKHLDLLVEHGFVARLREDRARRGRPRFVYAAAPSEPPAAEAQLRNYRLLASVFAEYLSGSTDPHGEAEEAGRRLGARTMGQGHDADEATPTAQQRVVRMLDEIGFDPEVSADGQAILLHRCPFHELAQDRPDIVCAIHLGLIRGALQELGLPQEAVRLVPSVTPRLCVLELGLRPPALGTP
jgi:predicted ArsR family transcriptional regulator